MPEIKVEVAFDSGFATPMADRTYMDVSEFVEAQNAISISHGRADELSTPSPGSCSLTLDNSDGRFTPGKATSPHYPNVKKGKPVKVSVRYAGVWYTRFTGYIDEWPLTWPDGSDAVSHMTITASTRRARLGNTAPLTSAIRAAYLETAPLAYWPMDEDADVVDATNRQAFRDVTNTGPTRDDEVIGAFSTTAALAPVVRDGTAGPTDEQSLVRFPPQTTFNTFDHYIGSGNTVRFNTAAEFTMEVVARIRVDEVGTQNVTYLFGAWTADQGAGIEWLVASDTTGSAGDESGGGPAFYYLHPTTGVDVGSDIVNLYDPEVYITATDGDIHHYGITLTGGNTVTAYLDGVAVRTGVLTAPYTFDQAMTNVAFGELNAGMTVWLGHGAVHDRALTAAEMLTRASAAVAASESVEDRVVRVAGRAGVPAAEVVVETTIASGLGPQPEAGRSVAEVLDEVATSTGGVLYDTREGLLAMQARNHRYNNTAAFSLSAAAQEIDGDLTGVLDDRYLVNTVDATRAASSELPFTASDQDSVDEYGIYARQVQIVADHDLEVEAAAQNLLNRFAEPRVRVSTVGVDVVNLSTAQRALVLTADIGTAFQIASLPAQAPTDPLPLFLEGYTETITASSHTLTANTTPGMTTTVWVLGSGTYSVLGSTTIPAY